MNKNFKSAFGDLRSSRAKILAMAIALAVALRLFGNAFNHSALTVAWVLRIFLTVSSELVFTVAVILRAWQPPLELSLCKENMSSRMERAHGKSLSVASSGGFRTPDQLAGDVNKRDREWSDWERESIQAVVNQLNEILTNNYPGHGWLRIDLDGSYSESILRGLKSAFGKNVLGLRKAVEQIFSTAQWRVITQLRYDEMRFYFQPLHVPLRWHERCFGVRETARFDAHLDRTKFSSPPTSLRPNHRSMTEISAVGVSVGSTTDSQASAPAFPYENLC